MNREMIVFGTLTVLLGTVLFAGLHLEPKAEPMPQAQSREMAPANVPPPESQGQSGAQKERKNPFAPPVEVKPISQPKPPKPPTDVAPPPPPPPPPSTVVNPAPKTITDWSPAEIPVGFAGIFALPGQPAEAHLTAKDGSTMIVHVGDEIKSMGVKIVDITATDVTVEVGDRRASLRDLILKTTPGTTGGSGTGSTPTPGPGTNAPPAVNRVGDILKKLTGGGGAVDFGQLKNLSPEELQQLMNDPAVKKLIEEQTRNNNVQNPPGTNENRRGPGGNRGGRGNRGGNGENRGEGEGRPAGEQPLEAGAD